MIARQILAHCRLDHAGEFFSALLLKCMPQHEATTGGSSAERLTEASGWFIMSCATFGPCTCRATLIVPTICAHTDSVLSARSARASATSSVMVWKVRHHAAVQHGDAARTLQRCAGLLPRAAVHVASGPLHRGEMASRSACPGSRLRWQRRQRGARGERASRTRPAPHRLEADNSVCTSRRVRYNGSWAVVASRLR